jgi:pimeloyl-ACP methyl ester carboxylesterase
MRRPALLAALAAALGVATAASGAGLPGGDWVRTDLVAEGRVLASARPPGHAQGRVLTIVFEGDGAAHDRRGRPSADPTPRRPVGLEIARAWPGEPRAWLGRPCQFTLKADPACAPEDWTSARFSASAVAAADAAVDQLKAQAGAEEVRLVGWSGGGVLAMLVAARRDDVAGVVTFAAPLDLAAWTDWHGLSPLTDALNPAGLPPMPATPQTHVFGSFDQTVPPAAVLPAARRLAGPGGRVEVWPEGHACCWARRLERVAGAAASVASAAGLQPAHEPAAAP